MPMGYSGSSGNGPKTYSQRKRDKFPYREAYLKHNRGIAGTWYLCYNCGKILTKSTMQVDHIIPLNSKFGFNRLFNCSTLCEKCNKTKSDKLEAKYVVKGYLFKVLEEISVLAGRVLSLGFKGLGLALIFLVRSLLTPMFTDRSAVQKGVIVILLLVIIL